MSYLKSFERLEKLHKVDLGFYVLGLHSFMESYIKDVTGVQSDYFADTLYNYDKYITRLTGSGLHHNFINKLKIDHNNTNRVRHDFSQIMSVEAEASTQNFIQFLKKSDIKAEEYNCLNSILKHWKNRINNSAEESKKLQLELIKAKDKIALLEIEVGDSKSRTVELELLKKEKQVLDHKLEHSKESLETLTEDKKVLEDKISELSDSATSGEALKDYIHYLSRFSLYTRTRAEYERSVLRLSVKQKEAIERISLKKDFLVKGSAGTGKSLVLIKALFKAKEMNYIGEDITKGRVLLLTYSKTLKKYNSYMADLLESSIDEKDILTVDSFLLKKFSLIFPDFKLEPYYKSEYKEYLSEFENFILAGNITKEEYLGGIIRSGMKDGIRRDERVEIWESFSNYIEDLEGRKIVTFSYLRYKLLNYLLENPSDKGIRDTQYMFIDEVQDMTPSSLAALKELSTGLVVMAGDNNQKIFAATSPFKRAGINLQGKTFTLNENFRNTNQILNFANTFIKNTSEDFDDGTDSFRDGPLPEVNLVKGSITNAVIDQLKIYTDDLGYERHNIAIIVNSITDNSTKKLLNALDNQGIPYSDISSNNFDFSSENSVRITTLHRCKGLDFPVVLLSVPYLKAEKNYDNGTNNQIVRNLFYVAFTRAMDNLNIFIKDKPKGVLKEIYECSLEIQDRFVTEPTFR